MKVLEWALTRLSWFPSIQDGKMQASKSEIRRLVADGALELNDVRARPEDEMPEEVWSIVFFPKGRRKTSYYWLPEWQRGNWPSEEAWEALSEGQRAWWRWACGPISEPVPEAYMAWVRETRWGAR